MLEWQRENLNLLTGDRPIALVLVRPRCGETEWALSFGRPINMTAEWNIDILVEDATDLVVTDAGIRRFSGLA